MSKNISHLISLNVAGGVESLFADYIANSEAGIEHSIINDRDNIHSSLKDKIKKNSHYVYNTKTVKGFKIPKSPQILREINFNKIPKHNLVLWNKLNESYLNTKRISGYIYYDHGSIWHETTPTNPIVKNAKSIICVSSASKYILEKVHGANNVTILSNPVRLSKREMVIKPRSLQGKNTIHLGCAGRLLPTKGFRSLLEAMPQINNSDVNYVLHIAGEGPEKDRLISLTKQLNIKSKVIFHGHLKNISPFYQFIDIFITPSIHEPFGLVTLEAAAHGIPVIASRIDGIDDFIMENINGLLITPSLDFHSKKEPEYRSSSIPPYVFDPEKKSLTEPKRLNPKLLAKKIVELSSSETLYKKISTNNTELAEQHSIKEFTSKLNSILLKNC